MWSGAVGGNAFDFDAEIIAACHARAGFKIHKRSVELPPDVCAVNCIDIVQKTMLNIVLGTVTGFFSSLKNDFYIALQIFTAGHQHTYSTKKHGNVAVMSAGMHNTRCLTAERKSGVFFDRKRVNICTESDGFSAGRSLAALDHCPETIIIRIIMRSKSHFLQKLPDLLSRVFFCKGKLRMCMKISALFNDPGFVFLCHSFKVHKSDPF